MGKDTVTGDVWERIQRGVASVTEDGSKRVDGERLTWKWKIYRVGTVVRIDLQKVDPK